MTDDQTRPIETPAAADPAASAGSATAATGAPAPAPEGTAAAAGSVPVAPVSPGNGRARWFIAAGIAGVAIAAMIGGVLLLSRPATPTALSYVPGDAPFVAELRLDLPGDQTQHLGNLLAHFPGFADQSTLTDKIDEALSQLVGMAGGAAGVGADYRTDIKPWLNGALFVGVIPPAGGIETAGSEDFIVSATTNGAVDCTATFEGQTVTHEAYRGLDLVLAPEGRFACVIDGRQALIGDPATVRKALDAKTDATGMDKRAEYAAARTALGGDRLATLYLNGTTLQALMENPTGGVPELPSLMRPAIPAWIMTGVRAEDDALVIDTVTGPIPAATAGPSLLPMPAGHASLIAPMLPADTLAYLEIQGAGVGLQNLLTQLREVPELAQPLAMLDGLGGGGGLVSWIDDVGIAVSVEGTTPETLAPDVALVLVARDEATARSTVSSLDTMLGLAGLGGGLAVSEETINGVQVTTVTITDLGALIPPGTVPGVEVPALDGPVSFSIAARGRAVILTFGDGAMADVVNAGAGTSLADDAAFKQAAARGVANSQSTMYVAAGAAFDFARGFLPPAELAQFNTAVAPYLDPLDAVLITGSSDAAGARSRIVITVTTP
jgi:hypothetical protein